MVMGNSKNSCAFNFPPFCLNRENLMLAKCSCCTVTAAYHWVYG